MSYILLIIGFAFLIKGASLFVDGSASIAKIFRVPSVIIGLTIVAMGTSAPEAAVSITAGLSGSNDIALGNIIGSNIFNLLCVSGFCAVFNSLPANRSILRRDFPVCLAATALLFLTLLDSRISFLDGLVLFTCMVIYLVYIVRHAIKNKEEMDEDYQTMPLPKSILYIVIGLIGILIGGKVVVNSATDIASTLGLSENLIALTVVAIGTSLPELVTSLVAAKKGETDLALGNVIGSNLFNILFILGASSMVHPIAVGMESIIDITVLIIVSIVMFVFCLSGKRVSRGEGLASLAIYISYTAYIILR